MDVDTLLVRPHVWHSSQSDVQDLQEWPLPFTLCQTGTGSHEAHAPPTSMYFKSNSNSDGRAEVHHGPRNRPGFYA